MEKLLQLLKGIRPDIDFNSETKLVDDSILDSFDIITIVSEINEVFEVNINVADMEPENLNSINAIWELIEKLKNLQ